MSPWTVYFLAAISIACPINHYFKATYGERNIPATVLLSIFWFIIPVVSAFRLTEVFDYMRENIISHKKGE